MGGSSSKQVTGYKYFANFLLFIGNPIERLIAINFDKRGWDQAKRVPYGSNGEQITIDTPNLYGENEGGVSGLVYLKTGTDTQTPVEFYQDYLESVSLPALAYPYQSYLAFKDFYLGNSGYMKEMLLWPKRIHVKNDGSEQWYDEKAEIRDIIIGESYRGNIPSLNSSYTVDFERDTTTSSSTYASAFPLRFLLNTNFSDGFASYIDTYIRDAPEIMYKLEGYARFPNYIPEAYEQAIFSIIGLQVKDTVVTRNLTITGQYDFVAYGMPDEAGDFGLHVENPTGSTGIISLFTTFPYWGNGLGFASGDINPIHKIREILTDDTAMNKPESDVNDTNFMKAADRIYDEGLGISWAITEKSCVDAINELCSHIEAGVRVNRQTGLYEVVLFRDDWFEESEIHTLTENKIKSISFEVQNADEAINQLNISYYDRENIKDASFSTSENAAIKNANGFVNAENADFPYFMNQRNAAVVAQWKLKQYTSPCWKGSFTTGFYEARKWNRYDIVKINWSRKNIVDLPVRIMSINLGDGVDNTVSIEFVEVVPFSDELTSTVVIDDKIDTAPLPPQPAVFKAFELPYFEAVQSQGQKTVDDELAYNPDIGYVAVVAQRPQNNSLNAQMHTNAGTGYENSAVIQYCETAKLDQAIDRASFSFIVKNVGDIDSVRVGSQIFINDETMVYQSFDAVTKLLTVKRGALDTMPQSHTEDSILFFADDFVAADQTQYMDGEVIDVKAVTTTPSGVLDLDDVDVQSVEIQSRAIRPYPPANVQINGEYFPAEISGGLVLTWADRNRQQQTGGSILGWYEGGVTLESDVEYVVELYDADDVLISSANVGAVNTATVDYSTVTTATCTVKLYAIKNGYASYQAFEHELIASFNPPYNLAGTWNGTTSSVDLTWSFDE